MFHEALKYIVLKFHAAKITSSTLKELGKSVTKLMSGPVYMSMTLTIHINFIKFADDTTILTAGAVPEVAADKNERIPLKGSHMLLNDIE